MLSNGFWREWPAAARARSTIHAIPWTPPVPSRPLQAALPSRRRQPTRQAARDPVIVFLAAGRILIEERTDSSFSSERG